jgi:hypothetical protein
MISFKAFIANYLTNMVSGAVGVSAVGDVDYRIDFSDGTSRAATNTEILDAHKAYKIRRINDECRNRLLARYGTAEEQVSRSLGIYGAAEKAAMETGIAATIDASNAASNVVLGSTTIEQVEAVTVTWPVI